MIVTGTSDVNPDIQGYYDRNLLMRAQPERIHDLFGQIRPIPKKSGTRITFRLYGSLSPALTPLVEGVTPSGSKLSSSDIYASLKQYGDYVTVSDWVNMVSMDPVLVEAGEVLGEQAGDTWDLLTRSQLIAGANVRYANGVAARASIVSVPVIGDIKSIVRTLRGNNAKPIREMILPSTKVATRAIRPSFVGITHTDAEQDMEDIAGFTTLEDYSMQKNVMPGEFGAHRGIRFLSTTNSKIWASSGGAPGSLVSTNGSNADVYSCLVLAKNAYGIVPLSKKNIKNFIKSLGSAGSADPINQRATSGWKFAHTSKILQDDFIVRWEFGVTDL